jgi:hypothetical protein
MKFKKLAIVALLISIFTTTFVYADDYKDCLRQCDKEYSSSGAYCGLLSAIVALKGGNNGFSAGDEATACLAGIRQNRDKCYQRCIIEYER